MSPIDGLVIEAVRRMPDPLLRALYWVDRGSELAWKRLRLKQTVRRSAGRHQPTRKVRFLCFLGVNWYNHFLLRKMREYGFDCYSETELPEFKGWAVNHRQFTEIELPRQGGPGQPDFILLDQYFYVNRRLAFGHEVMARFVKRISCNFTIPVIGIDNSDTILSKFLPRDVDCFDLVLKGQCLPRDRELINWEIGVRWGLNRKEKIRRLRFEEMIFSQAQIDKMRLSFDLGAATYGDVELPPPPAVKERYDLFLVAVFDSLNRLHGLRLAAESCDTLGWLQLIEAHPVVGIESWKADPALARPENRAVLNDEIGRLYRQYRPFFRRARISQRLYTVLARASRIMPAFSGIGELGPRHYHALALQKAMVCEDLSYVDTIFPFEHGHNCLFVADELEDLAETLRYLLADEAARKRIAGNGFRQLGETYRDGDQIFEEYFLKHLGIEA